MSTQPNSKGTSGFTMLFVLLGLTVLAIWLTIGAMRADNGWGIGGGFAAIVVLLTMWCGFFTLEPNQAAVMNLFGRYVGTARDAGLRWTNPFYTKKKISLRVRNFESGRLKVNELEGSPIEIGAVVVWQVVDTFEATFHVDNYEDFVHIQSESALRQ